MMEKYKMTASIWKVWIYKSQIVREKLEIMKILFFKF